jgi:hypothetical protein
MSKLYDVGQYDVLIQGGGPSGILEAVRQRKLGKRVLLIEGRSGLLWQVARARQGELTAVDNKNDPTTTLLLDFLKEFQAIRAGKLESSYSEIAADQWLISHDVQVLFQAKLLQTDGDIATIALKGKVGTTKVHEVIDMRELVNSGHNIDCTKHPYSIWTLTLLNVPIDQDVYSELDIQGRKLQIRLRSSYHPSDTMVDIAFSNSEASQSPIELLFANDIPTIVTSIRTQRAEWSEAKMISMCDEPWIPEQQDPFRDTSGQKFWRHATNQFNSLFR